MKNLIRTLSFSLLFLLVLSACDSNSNKLGLIGAGGEMSMDDGAAIPEMKDVEEVRDVERKLIKEGWMEFEADDIPETRTRIEQAIQRYHAYASADDVRRSDRRLTHSIVIRVPAQHFDSLMADVGKGVSHFDSKQVNVKDVTEEYLDVETRLKTKKELEARYLELLGQAKTVTEVLEIEREIGELRTDIESIEGRLNFLKDRVAFSTLTVTFYETYATADSWADRFGEGFGNGWRNLVWFLVGMVNVWPFLLLILGVIFLIRRLAKGRKAKKAS